MTITTGGVAVYLTPTVTKTFFKHYYKKAKRSIKNDRRPMRATDELMFDEAFNIVKSFIDMGTSDTVEAIQKFTDAPAPPIPWATTLQVIVPMESCDRAAKIIIEHLGPEDLRKLVGGEKWWQLRSLPGVQGEWIAMSDDWKKMKAMEKQDPKATAAEKSKQVPSGKSDKQKRRRNKRHERTQSEIRRMAARPESGRGRSSALRNSEKTATPATSSNSRKPLQPDEEAIADEETEEELPAPGTGDEDEPSADDDASTYTGAAEREELDRLQRVMLYFHGGGYYFGSLATHRYQIVRYARKFGGKCFAPIYRKAPQYPWPCALQDAVASYLYLIDPPADAKHSPVDPKKLVIAGDSAGGGLTLALLTVIRDMGLPAPAGAVLISPWCDLTHSFPSILQNTATDIIPPHGFIHKPSTLWPINATKPDKGKSSKEGDDLDRKVPVGVKDEDEDNSKSKKDDDSSEPAARKSFQPGSKDEEDAIRTRAQNTAKDQKDLRKGVPPAPDLLWSEPLKIDTADPEKQDIELREQIQLYATNDQLMHPLCSAVLSGSLGGLPPLYILAGDAEVLRDEIVYLAHRAAHPDKYPLRHDLLDHSQRNRENAQKYDSQPTKVHLQIYDQMCHVLTAFAFTSQSRFAYRGVASFVKHVTGAPTNIKNPFPEVAEGEQAEEEDSEADDEVFSPPQQSLASSQHSGMLAGNSLSQSLSLTPSNGGSSQNTQAIAGSNNPTSSSAATSSVEPEPFTSTLTESKEEEIRGSRHPAAQAGLQSSQPLREEPRQMSGAINSTGHETTESSDVIASRRDSNSKAAASSGHPHAAHRSSNNHRTRSNTGDVKNEYAGQVPLMRPSFQSFMIRERVDVQGFLRPLEPETELQALQLKPDQIGCIKEGPVARYLEGQEEWAKRYEKVARKVEKKRAQNEDFARKILEEAATQGLLDVEQLKQQHQERQRLQQEGAPTAPNQGSTFLPGSSSRRGSLLVDAATASKYKSKWTWLTDFGPMDLGNETPPPAAIAGRRDTEDALALLRQSLQIRAKAYGIKRKSKLREDKIIPAKPIAEQSIKANSGSSTTKQGLRIWNLLMVKGNPAKKVVPASLSSSANANTHSEKKEKAYPAQTRKSAFSSTSRKHAAHPSRTDSASSRSVRKPQDNSDVLKDASASENRSTSRGEATNQNADSTATQEHIENSHQTSA